MTLFRQKMLVVATGGLLVGLAIATATPHHPASAQSGQSLVFAEHACLEYSVTPYTPAFESCVSRAARAFDRGEPDVAYLQARATREARDACLSYGVSPETLGYQQCIATQIERRLTKPMLIRYVPPAK